jgi:uncharacterized membrane protein YccC
VRQTDYITHDVRGARQWHIGLPAPSVSVRKLRFALVNTTAVLTALYIAFARDLERPYWAMFTVFIVADPISGAVRSKSVYRFLGTFAGAASALLLIPPLVQSPVLLCTAMSLWIGACLYLSLLDRTPRSSACRLAGYTAAIVGLSVVNAPETVFDVSVARVEEISLGLICATLAHSLIFRSNVMEGLNEKIATTLQSFSRWLSQAITRSEQLEDIKTEEELARVVSELHVLYTLVTFETSEVPRPDRIMRTLQDRLTALLPALTGVQRAIAALRAQHAVRPSILELLEAIARWARQVAQVPRVQDEGVSDELSLRASFAAVSIPGPLSESLDWRTLLERALVTQLRDLVTALADCQVLAAALRDPEGPLPQRLEREAAMPGRRILHRDRGLALLSAGAAAGATLIACVLWIDGSWPEGGIAAEFTAVGSSMFAMLDNPTKIIRVAVIGILSALPLAAVYEFAIFPRIDGFASLALVLSPALFLMSLVQSSERLRGAGLLIVVLFAGALALQETYRPDFASFVNSNTAEVGGLIVAAATSLAFRTIDPAWNALRISKAGWRAVRRLSGGQHGDIRRWALQMFDRFGLATARLKDADRATALGRWDIDGLRDLRVGLNVAVLQRMYRQFGAPSASALENVLRAVSAVYCSRLGGLRESADVERAIDAGIAALGAEPPTSEALSGLAALTGLRLDLAQVGTRYRTPAPAA